MDVKFNQESTVLGHALPRSILHRQAIEQRDQNDDRRIADHIHEHAIFEIVIKLVSDRHGHAQCTTCQRVAHADTGRKGDSQREGVRIQAQFRRNSKDNGEDDKDRRRVGNKLTDQQDQQDEDCKQEVWAHVSSNQISERVRDNFRTTRCFQSLGKTKATSQTADNVPVDGGNSLLLGDAARDNAEDGGAGAGDCKRKPLGDVQDNGRSEDACHDDHLRLAVVLLIWFQLILFLRTIAPDLLAALPADEQAVEQAEEDNDAAHRSEVEGAEHLRSGILQKSLRGHLLCGADQCACTADNATECDGHDQVLGFDVFIRQGQTHDDRDEDS